MVRKVSVRRSSPHPRLPFRRPSPSEGRGGTGGDVGAGLAPARLRYHAGNELSYRSAYRAGTSPAPTSPPVPPLPSEGEGRLKGNRGWGLLLSAVCSLLLAGCQQTPPTTVNVAPGVVFRRDVAAGVQIVDTDLRTAHVRPVLVADHIERRRNNFIGDCKTVREWGVKYGAVAGVECDVLWGHLR